MMGYDFYALKIMIQVKISFFEGVIISCLGYAVILQKIVIVVIVRCCFICVPDKVAIE